MTKKRHELHCETGLLSEFSDEELAEIARFGIISDLAKGNTLFVEGEEGDRLFMVISGQVDIMKVLGIHGEHRPIARVGAGTMLGELSVVDGQPYSATAVACEPARVLILSHDRLDELSSEQPKIGVQILNGIAKIMARRLRATTNRLVDQYELALEAGWIASVTD